MTTTAFYQTAELDLDKLEALARDAEVAGSVTMIQATKARLNAALTPSTVLALIAQARATGTQALRLDEAIMALLCAHTKLNTDGIDDYTGRIAGLLNHVALQPVPAEELAEDAENLSRANGTQGASETKGKSAAEWYVAYCEQHEKRKAADGAIKRYEAENADLRAKLALQRKGQPVDELEQVRGKLRALTTHITTNAALMDNVSLRILEEAIAVEGDAAPQASREVPEGFVLAPKVPTDAMRDAGNVIMLDRCKLFQVWGAMLAAAPSPVSAEDGEKLTPLDYRAQGREEALAIILGQSAEDALGNYVGCERDCTDEYTSYWREDKLRELLHIGDRKHDAFGRAEATYWSALGEKDEAQRARLLAEQAPFFAPLHDFLSKQQSQEAWELLRQLQTAGSDAARDVMAERRRQVAVEGRTTQDDDAYVQGELGAYAAFYAMPPGAREWPAEETGYGATWGEAIIPDDWTPPKPGDRRRELVKAGALVLAEIERLDRAVQKPIPTCKVCDGEGVVHTGILESPTTLCNACDGSGNGSQKAGGAA